MALCNSLLCSLKHETAGRIRFLPEEKILTVYVKVSRMNDSWLAREPEDLHVVARTEFPVTLHFTVRLQREGRHISTFL